MRALNSNEISIINGAGAAQVNGAALGEAIGNVVDVAVSIFGITSNAKPIGKLIGSGIGSLIELDFTNGFKSLTDGIMQVIKAFSPTVK